MNIDLHNDKLGASPQPVESLKVVRLEYWNSGIIKQGVRDNGMMHLKKKEPIHSIRISFKRLIMVSLESPK